MLRAKKVPESQTAFISDVARKFWRRTSKNDVAKEKCLWGFDSTKLLFSMDSASPWTGKVEKEFCHGFGKLRHNAGKLRHNAGKLRCNVGKLRRNVWELRCQQLMFFHYIFFLLGKQSNKIKPRFQNLLPIQVYSFAFEPQRVHTYQWNWRSPKNDDDVAPVAWKICLLDPFGIKVP